MDVSVGLWRKLSAKELMLLNCGVGGLLRVPWTARRSNQSILKRSVLGVHWKEWCWSWNSNTLATWCEELTHCKRPWCWEGLGAGGEGDNRGWDGWMASPTQWTWLWVNSRSWWWTGSPAVLQFGGSQRVGQDWATELNWKESWSVSGHSAVTQDLTQQGPLKDGSIHCQDGSFQPEKSDSYIHIK